MHFMADNTLQGWFETPLGRYLLDKERAYLDDVTPDIFGFHAVQVGLPDIDLLRESRIAHCVRVAHEGHPDIYANGHELPFADAIRRPRGAAARAGIHAGSATRSCARWTA
jgi:hypothetical protein